jgi:drug/metabolite transporter (DMT)-like permease
MRWLGVLLIMVGAVLISYSEQQKSKTGVGSLAQTRASHTPSR